MFKYPAGFPQDLMPTEEDRLRAVAKVEERRTTSGAMERSLGKLFRDVRGDTPETIALRLSENLAMEPEVAEVIVDTMDRRDAVAARVAEMLPVPIHADDTLAQQDEIRLACVELAAAWDDWNSGQLPERRSNETAEQYVHRLTCALEYTKGAAEGLLRGDEDDAVVLVIRETYELYCEVEGEEYLRDVGLLTPDQEQAINDIEEDRLYFQATDRLRELRREHEWMIQLRTLKREGEESGLSFLNRVLERFKTMGPRYQGGERLDLENAVEAAQWKLATAEARLRPRPLEQERGGLRR
jgi:hypothetical protein